jgi:uncharacterized protein YkwD
MSRPHTTLAATLTLVLLAALSSLPTAAFAASRPSVNHSARHHARPAKRHAVRHDGHNVTPSPGTGPAPAPSRPSRVSTHHTHVVHAPHRGVASAGTPHGTAAADRTAAIAAVLATPCQNTELTPTAGNLDLVRGAVLCLINRERAQNGEVPLTLNPQLQQAAEGHAAELVSADYFEHVSPSGLTPVDRIRNTGYIPNQSVGYVIGENLAWGTLNLATPQSIVGAWIASPGHLANILESQYTDTGIGVTAAVPPSLSGGQAGATYAQEFGVILD